MAKKKKVELPHILVEAVKEKRAVLILGAGASKESKNSEGHTPPDGFQMRDLLAEKYLGVKNDQRDLMTVSEMAIANGHGEALVFDEIARMLKGFVPSEAHKAITKFAWRGLATTNYDTLAEDAYASVGDALQTCVKFIKDNEPYSPRLADYQNSVPYFKLHGCLVHRLDREAPLVLSHEHYNRVAEHRVKLFQRLQGWAETSVLIFVGYKLADSHIRDLIYRIDPTNRPQWYLVTPNADANDEAFWATKSVGIIQRRFGEFMADLEEAIPPLFRSLSSLSAEVAEPYQKHFRSSDAGSDFLRSALATEFSYVHSGLPFEEISPKKFYEGYDSGWCGITRKFDFPRKSAERMLYSALSVEEDDKSPRFVLLKGSAGSGKTIALRRAAYDAATALDELVLWANNGSAIRYEVVEELYGLTGKRLVLFVDEVSLRVDDLHSLLRRTTERSIPVTIIAAEREADWASYCGKLETDFPPEVFQLGRLSSSEAEDLVDLLERHNSLGFLAPKSKEDRIAAFMEKGTADRQLLVALHELTLGKPFEEIILDEYQKITPDNARRLYLDISTMHQFGVVARAGAISRVSGVRFSDFESDFFLPLSDIVSVVDDRYTGDKGYVCRHARVAQIVFGEACPNDTEKSVQLERILSGLDIAYSSDERIIESICKGRAIAEQFADIDHARNIFDMACGIAPHSAFIFQQAAILEYTHRHGSLDRAFELATEARSIDDSNHIYLHTLAEVSRRMANEAATRPRKEQLRSQSRTFLNDIRFSDSRKDLTFCKLLIDETIDELKSLPSSPKDHQVIEFDAKVDDAVTRLQRAKADFPDVPEFLTAEATLWQKLGESEKSLKALEKAAQVRPRNANVFTRLANVSKKVKSPSDAVSVLRGGLEKFPTDKSLHHRLAMELLEQNDEIDQEVELHLRSSFAVGDHNFDARYHLAEFLFLIGKVDDCVAAFAEIDRRAPDTFRQISPKSHDSITSKIERRSGKVIRRNERIFFVQSPSYPNAIFAHFSSLVDFEYDQLSEGKDVSFRVMFSRKGPVAVDVRVI